MQNKKLFKKRFNYDLDQDYKDDFKYTFSKDDKKIPYIDKRLYSNFVKKEIERYFNNLNYNGTIIIPGLICIYYIEYLIDRDDIKKIFIIENSKDIFLSLMNNIDMTKIFKSKKVFFYLDYTLDKNLFINFIMKNYLPILDLSLKFLDLSLIYDVYKEQHLSYLKETFKEIINKLKIEYSTRSHLSYQWYLNTIKNIFQIHKINLDYSILKKYNSKKILLIGAGVSLENNIKLIKEFSKKDYYVLLVCDTAYPVMLKYNIKVDIVMTIDPQIYSYRHFFKNDNDTLFICFFSSCNIALKRLKKLNLLFIYSNNPFELLIREFFGGFLLNENSLNVGERLLKFSLYLKPISIKVFGIDFAYLNSKTYSKGTYLEDEFNNKSYKLDSYLNKDINTYILDKDLVIKKNDCYINYLNKRFIAYKDATVNFLNNLVKGYDVELDMKSIYPEIYNIKSIKNNREIIFKKYYPISKKDIYSFFDLLKRKIRKFKEEDLNKDYDNNIDFLIKEIIINLAYFYKRINNNIDFNHIIDNIINQINKYYEK